MDNWDQLVSGAACPFDDGLPDESEFGTRVAKLSVSSVFLQHNQAWYGHCMLVFEPRHVVRAGELTPAEWQSLMADVYQAERAIHAIVQPQHINVASLGNMVPHLHWHVIPRFKQDPRWRRAIWTDAEDEAYEHTLTAGERAILTERLRSAMQDHV